MKSFLAALRRLGSRLAGVLIVLTVLRPCPRCACAAGPRAQVGQRRSERQVLPSLYDRYPHAGSAPRRAHRHAQRGRRPHRRHDAPPVAEHGRLPAAARTCAAGTGRADGSASTAPWNGWHGSRRSISCRSETTTTSRTATTGSRPARQAGALEIDADVTQLLVPGVTQPGQATLDASSLIGAAEVRQAGAGPPVADRRAAQRERRRTPASDLLDDRRERRRDRSADRCTWPDPTAVRRRDGRPIRILAVSDEPDPSLDSPVTRERTRARRPRHRRR